MVDRFRRSADAPVREHLRDWRTDWYEPSPWEGRDGRSMYGGWIWERKCGGDLRGLREAFPYLKDLGVNALYLLPVFQAQSPHKYDATNYLHIDEHYGAGAPYLSSEAAEDLLDPATWRFDPNDRLFLEVLRDAKRAG
ncbi:MAG: hypothetical protein RL721_901, partial [Candidatus Eisenbacteria bacterium]